MSKEAQAAEQQATQLPVATYRPAKDGNVEELWQGIERAYKTSRQHNREVLRDHVGVATASVLAFSNQMLHMGLLSMTPETENVETEDEGPPENPPQPGNP